MLNCEKCKDRTWLPGFPLVEDILHCKQRVQLGKIAAKYTTLLEIAKYCLEIAKTTDVQQASDAIYQNSDCRLIVKLVPIYT